MGFSLAKCYNQNTTMKFLVVVVAALAKAEPEADPAYLYRGYYGHPYAYAPWGFGYGYLRGFYGRSAYGYALPGGYTHVDRLHKREADPQFGLPLVYNGAIAPAAFAPLNPLVYNYPVPTAPATYIATPPVAVATPAIAAARPYTPHDCVTAEGCAVRTLKEAGLAKRSAEADAEAVAEAEAEAEAAYYYGGYYGGYYNPYYRFGYYNGFYNYPYNYYGAYGYPYTYPYAAPAAPAAPVAPVVKAAPVPAPLPVAPVPVKVAKKVTYTHLGAHPIHPTSVLEETTVY